MNLVSPKTDRSWLYLLLCLHMVLLAGCGKSLELKSQWANRPVIVDGINTEWKDVLVPVEDKGTSVGVLNDDEYLYLCVITTDRSLQRQMTRQGVTFWFDREGGEDKKFGIHYPARSGEFGPAESRQTEEGQEPNFRRDSSFDVPYDVEIYGPRENEQHQMTLAEAGGIDARFRMSRDTLVYELKVPLMDTGPHPFAIGTKAGELVGVGVETTGFRGGEGPWGESPGGYGSGRGGGFGGRGGGFGGRGGGPRGGYSGERPRSGSRPEPLKVWAKVQLGTKTA